MFIVYYLSRRLSIAGGVLDLQLITRIESWMCSWTMMMFIHWLSVNDYSLHNSYTIVFPLLCYACASYYVLCYFFDCQSLLMIATPDIDECGLSRNNLIPLIVFLLCDTVISLSCPFVWESINGCRVSLNLNIDHSFNKNLLPYLNLFQHLIRAMSFSCWFLLLFYSTPPSVCQRSPAWRVVRTHGDGGEAARELGPRWRSIVEWWRVSSVGYRSSIAVVMEKQWPWLFGLMMRNIKNERISTVLRVECCEKGYENGKHALPPHRWRFRFKGPQCEWFPAYPVIKSRRGMVCMITQVDWMNEDE